MHIIGFLIFGLVVGLLARAIYPGPQPMGWVATAVLGMIGSLVGGLLGHALFGTNNANTGLGFSPGGLISSIIGAMIVLWFYIGIARKARTV
jgi:uncharacterized membrane protein YeaQ/YmgE (transglycosylase-associated protein family)